MTKKIAKEAIPAETLRMLERGARLHPLKPKAKEPCINAWQKKATNQRDQIEQWAQRFVECNWGIAAGQESGFFVVDVDGEEGAATLERWKREHGRIWTQTLTVSTDKGFHLYYGFPVGAEIRNSAKKVAPGIDIRGNGGYVVAPGSIHPSGRIYEIVQDLPIAEPENWLLDLILDPPLSKTSLGAGTALVLASPSAECQGRSKTRPVWRSKSRPVDSCVVGVGLRGRRAAGA